MADFMNDGGDSQQKQRSYQQPQTFSQMQQQGVARPPSPSFVAPYNYYGNPNEQQQQPNQQQPQQQYQPQQPPQQQQPQTGPNQSFGGGIPPQWQQPQGGGSPQPNYILPKAPEQMQYNGPNIPQFQPQPGNGQFNQNMQNYAQNWMNNPNPYNQQVAQDIFKSLSNQVGQEFDVQRQLAQEQSARQGLSSSTVAQGRLGDIGIRQGQALSGLAAQIAQQAAMTNAGSMQAAGNFGLGVSQNNFGQGLQSYLANLQGQGQDFNQQYQQNMFNSQQDFLNNQLLMQLLGLT